MGWGDEIIAAGQARKNAQGNRSMRTMIRDRFGNIREHEAWRGNPRIVKPSDRMVGQIVKIVNGPGARPYISQKTSMRWVWKDWECPVGEIYLSEEEKKFAEAFSPQVIIEPWLKGKASPNKQWGLEKWNALVGLLRKHGLRVWQLGPEDTFVLPKVERIVTPSMRLACAVLARAKFAVLPEGGLHHAAAALGVPSAVIFGGYISPKQTGYSCQTNLFTAQEPCGMRIACKHCRTAMEKIEPAQVAEIVMGKINV